MHITDLVFDLYGTLVDIHTEESALVWEKTALYFSFHGASYTGQELHAAFNQAMRSREAQAGQSYECFPDIPFEQVMTELFRSRGAAAGADALGVNAAHLFRIFSIEYIRLYPGVLSALSALRAHGFRLWLLSNAQAAFTGCELRMLGLGPQFDGVLLSSDYGCRKPDSRFFHALMDKFSLRPESCLMIGNDRSTDIAGARACGMATLYMHTALTPAEQTDADSSCSPVTSAEGCRHFEFEGDDWASLAPMLLKRFHP